MENTELAIAVARAAERPGVRAAVENLYAAMEVEIARRRPLCVMSGKCCHFDEYGHRLYVTTMELAAFSAQTEPPNQAWDGKCCPFQAGRLCGAHSRRPMGCRLFFCDPSSTQWQNEQYELFHAKLKSLHEVMEVPYAYVEWRAALWQLGFK